jgi:hypothetical protein
MTPCLCLQLLKLAIKQARPSDRKADPGMPSAHANSLAFLVSIHSLLVASAALPPELLLRRAPTMCITPGTCPLPLAAVCRPLLCPLQRQVPWVSAAPPGWRWSWECPA